MGERSNCDWRPSLRAVGRRLGPDASHGGGRGVLENLVEVFAVERFAFALVLRGGESPSRTRWTLACSCANTILASAEASSVSKLNSTAELVEFRKQRGLIAPKTLIHVLTGEDVHAGFPVVEPARENHPRDQLLDVQPQVEDCVGNQRGAVNAANPRRVHAANDRARHQRIDVAVGEHDEARAQARESLRSRGDRQNRWRKKGSASCGRDCCLPSRGEFRRRPETTVPFRYPAPHGPAARAKAAAY